MKLIIYYTLISLVGDAVAAILCLGVEKVLPWLSMPLFLVLYFLVLGGSWTIAVRITEPPKPAAAAA